MTILVVSLAVAVLGGAFYGWYELRSDKESDESLAASLAKMESNEED